jgi:hypothetical protein
MNSNYWTSDVSLNYMNIEESGGIIQILNSMGNVNLQFKKNMTIGMIAVAAGGGGGGGQYNGLQPFSGGGGGGGAIYQVQFKAFKDISFNINVGLGGLNGNGQLPGKKGGDTTIYSNTGFGIIDISAGGGHGGGSYFDSGGTGSVADSSGGILTYSFLPNSSYNFENQNIYISEGYLISKGGDWIYQVSNYSGNTTRIIGNNGSGASIGYNNIPGNTNYLGYNQQFSGGGGSGYYTNYSYTNYTNYQNGYGGQPGYGYGGQGGQAYIDVPSSSSISPLTQGVSAEFYGAGGGGAGSNWNANYSNPPTWVIGGKGGDGILLIYYNTSSPVPPPPNLPTTGGPIRICDSRLRSCKHYSKNLPGSSGNVVRLINLQQYQRRAKWVQINAPTNGYGSRAGAPYGYGESPKNDFN